jgi:vacuolar-type H+-ATPase subunit H
MWRKHLKKLKEETRKERHRTLGRARDEANTYTSCTALMPCFLDANVKGDI